MKTENIVVTAPRS